MASITTEILINATPATVWNILTDFSAYPAWNPFILKIEGRPETGTRLKALIRPEGATGMTFTPLVLEATPEREFRWRGQLGIPGLMDGEHRFHIEPRPEGGVRFLHEENFTGILVPLFMGMMKTGSLAGFNAMNRAIKERAERAEAVKGAI